MDFQDQEQDQDGDENKEKKSDLRRMQFSLAMMQSDYKSGTRKRNEILAEITRLKKQVERINLDIGLKNKELAKLDTEMSLLQIDINGLNKKIKML